MVLISPSDRHGLRQRDRHPGALSHNGHFIIARRRDTGGTPRGPCDRRHQQLSGDRRAHPAHRRDAWHLSGSRRGDADNRAVACRSSPWLVEGNVGELVDPAACIRRDLLAAYQKLPYYDLLMAVGSDDRATYTAGVPVTKCGSSLSDHRSVRRDRLA